MDTSTLDTSIYTSTLDKSNFNRLIDDSIEHKKIVLDNCSLLAKHLISEGQVDLGIELLKRGTLHDSSKFDTAEFIRLASILKSKKCFLDANYKLSSTEINAIEHHWKHNRHHPEYFTNPSEEMTELDLLEMVCDWFARSIQYGTEFIPFIEERQQNRFHFEQSVFDNIHKYCTLIQDLYRNSKV